MYSNTQNRAVLAPNGFMLCTPRLIDDDDFARLHVAHEFGADDFQRAAFTDQHPGGIGTRRQIDTAENERAHAQGVTHADQRFVADRATSE